MIHVLPQRTEVAAELTWNVADIYPTDGAWESDFTALTQRLPQLVALQGTLGQSATQLATALYVRDDIGQLLERVFAYARLRADEDTANTHYQGLVDRIAALATQLSASQAFFLPEILAIAPTMLATWLAETPELTRYHHEIADITRERPHVLSAEVETILAAAGDIAQGSQRIFSMLANADIRFPMLTDEQGNRVQLTHGNYGVFTQSPDRAVRAAAYVGMNATFQAQQHTVAALYSAHIKQHSFYARQRGYTSTLAATLSSHNIPLGVYDNLVTTVAQGLPVLHRYLRLRQRILGIEQLHIYDLNAPLVPETEMMIPFADAGTMVVQAVQPLGPEYSTVLSRALTARWIDIPENIGKRSGAYSMGVYGVHPFVLLNYQQQLRDVFTLAHELGHSLHSYYAQATQPYTYAHYTIFIAEIASTFNEALLTHSLAQSLTERSQRIYLLTQQLNRIYSTLFRQTMFAAFEQQAHAAAERRVALTADYLCGIYRDLSNQYFGAAGMVVDDVAAWEWSRIPHFYRSFYVYQYATGVAASTALAQAVLAEGQPAVDRYLNLLKAGSSDYTIALLQTAGVDMTSPAPITAALAEFDRIVSEVEGLL